MIARVYTDSGQRRYVALHLDPSGHAKRVWVPITRETVADDGSLLMALLLCVLTLQASIGALLSDARKLCGLAEKRSPTNEQHRELQTVAQYVADTLEREGENLLRLVEQPTTDDQVALDLEYAVVETTDPLVELDNLLNLGENSHLLTILQAMLGQPAGRSSPETPQSVLRDDRLITRHQLRAGRVLSGLTVRGLAERAGLTSSAVNQIETGKTDSPRENTLKSLESALRDADIEFVRGGWVRHRSDRKDADDSIDIECIQLRGTLDAARELTHRLTLVLESTSEQS